MRNDGCGDKFLCQRGDIELVAVACALVTKLHIYEDTIKTAVKNGHTDDTVLELLKFDNVCEVHFESFGINVFQWRNCFFYETLFKFSYFFVNSLYTTLRRQYPLYYGTLSPIAIAKTFLLFFCLPERAEDKPFHSTRLKPNSILKNLKTLDLDICFDMSSEHLNLLLASPSLTHLKISNLGHIVMDNCFRQAVNVHQFRNLKMLDFVSLNVTKTGIDLLMNGGNPRMLVNFTDCRSLNVAHIKEWERLACEKTWYIVFNYKEYHRMPFP